jgi:hypothetical protein
MNALFRIHPLHEGTSAYATACFLSREKNIDGAELRRFAEGLMQASRPPRRRGAKVIGHIKAYIDTRMVSSMLIPSENRAISQSTAGTEVRWAGSSSL